MTELPYDFDLYFDIKSVEELHRILFEDSLDILHDQESLRILWTPMQYHSLKDTPEYINLDFQDSLD